ncbi:MAG TPA: CoA transferase [Acidimicrobiia bacterium]|jgi:crotonobetainyl-CoA:carnitine CoA-transferase CaiB-like acyl-CoA transferase
MADLPLTGLRVVDATVERGELAARLLGDLGAEVVKVEPPGGSPARSLPPVRKGVSLAWAVRNAGKLGVALDLDVDTDRARLDDLLAHADVLFASARRLAGRIDLRDVVARQPHLVALAITAYGTAGPFADYVATDAVLSASGGIAFKAGVLEGPPLFPPGHLVDDLVSATAAFAALCALYQREQLGVGQLVELSANEAVALCADWALPNVSARVIAGEPPAEVRNGSGPVYPVFKCTDGYVRLVVLSARQWRALREWIGDPEYLRDPELDNFVSRLVIAATVINPLLDEHFAKFGMDEAAAEAQRRGIVCTPALPPHRVLTNEHLASRGTLAPMALDGGVTAPVFTGFFEVDRQRAGPAAPPPGVGEHTEQVFGSLGPERTATAHRRPEPGAPLAGVRVMDFGIGAVGVEVGRRLAEYGAEVIKVESRAYIDFMRTVTGLEFSPSFVSSSRSKLGFGANAQTREGHDVLLRLVEHSDVVIENNSTGTMEDLRLAFADLAAANPQIVMVSSQLMGSHGTWADWRGYGPTGQGPGGLLHLWNYAGRDDPAGSASIYPDHYAGCLGAVGAVAALVGRARGTNAATHVEIAQVEAVVGSLADLLAAEGVAPGSVRPAGNRSERDAPWGLYPCAGDQQWVAITCRDDADWLGLRAAMGDPDWAGDAAYADRDGRLARAPTLDERVAAWTRGDTKDAIAARCQEHGVPAAPLLTGTDMGSHPHYVANDFAIRVDQPGLHEMVLDGAAFHGDLMVGPDVRRAPFVGEHTREIATVVLGLDDVEVDELLATGALETTPPVVTTPREEEDG